MLKGTGEVEGGGEEGATDFTSFTRCGFSFHWFHVRYDIHFPDYARIDRLPNILSRGTFVSVHPGLLFWQITEAQLKFVQKRETLTTALTNSL